MVILAPVYGSVEIIQLIKVPQTDGGNVLGLKASFKIELFNMSSSFSSAAIVEDVHTVVFHKA